MEEIDGYTGRLRWREEKYLGAKGKRRVLEQEVIFFIKKDGQEYKEERWIPVPIVIDEESFERKLSKELTDKKYNNKKVMPSIKPSIQMLID